MSIEVRGDRYRVRLRRDGRTFRRTFSSRAEAIEWEASVVASVERGEEPRLVEPPGPAQVRAGTVHEAADEFVRGMKTGAVRTRRGLPYKASTIRGHENRLRLYVSKRIGRVPLAQLRRGDVQRLIDDLTVDASPATAANVRDVLRLMLQRQVDLEVVDTNVAASVRAPTVEHAPARFLTAEEADQLQLAADAHPRPFAGAFVALMLGTGLRLGEAHALAWGAEGLDLDERKVAVRFTRGRRGELLPTKSRRDRQAPLGRDLVSRMLRYRLASGRPLDGERVFPTSHRRTWEQVRERGGFDDLRVHDLRHTAATLMLASGTSIHAVAEILGHVDATLVLRLYGHALPREVNDAGDRLEAWRASEREG